MSLYYEAAQVLDTAREKGGSIKSIVFGNKNWKSDRKAVFALSTEAAKWSEILSEVIEKSELLKNEKQISPTLTLLLTHDLLLSKTGLALPHKHGLHAAVSRHKARLSAELTKARIRRGAPSLDVLRSHVNAQVGAGIQLTDADSVYSHPRWVRVNTIRTSMQEQLRTTFADYRQAPKLVDVLQISTSERILHVDEHVPNLLALSPKIEITKLQAYKEGKLILQDKASCFPACLLDPGCNYGGLIDACAAPGNKTTHLAALVLSSTHTRDSTLASSRRIIACEKDAARSQTLQHMVKLAGADKVVRLNPKQDFLKLNPHATEYANITALLLDPSCSGSGIVGRDEVSVKVCLPSPIGIDVNATGGKKRKRTPVEKAVVVSDQPSHAENDEEEELKTSETASVRDRLEALSAFQLRLLQHAMTFPAAVRITYSTCSLHDEENEHVVLKALHSDVAKARGWRILERKDQVSGMQMWHHRGRSDAIRKLSAEESTDVQLDTEAIADACICCQKGTVDGTMGFFVAGFIRDSDSEDRMKSESGSLAKGNNVIENTRSNESEEEWEGFESDEG